MGAQTLYDIFEYCGTEKELFSRYWEYQQEDTYQKGHDPYSGSRAQCHLSVKPGMFPTLDDARNAARKTDPNKCEAVAFKYGDSKAFPATKADQTLIALAETLRKSYEEFDYDLLQRFVNSKSSTKKCTHCDSSISKKSRISTARSPFQARVSGPSAYQSYDRRRFSECPACGRNLLRTATDEKTYATLERRFKEADKKLHDARKKHQDNVKPYGYLVVSVVPI